MKRDKFPTRIILLIGQPQVQLVHNIISNAPIDAENPIEVIVREKQKSRKLDQNALMWVNQLSDIAEQAYVDGRKYKAEVWHEHFKELYLPEEFEEGITLEGYRKYEYTPSGKRVLIGSTKQLTVKGFSQYLEQIEAFGANLGVRFSAF